jgi:hypothetical protein
MKIQPSLLERYFVDREHASASPKGRPQLTLAPAGGIPTRRIPPAVWTRPGLLDIWSRDHTTMSSAWSSASTCRPASSPTG